MEDWVAHGNEDAIRGRGKMQKYGKDYLMQRDDVVLIHHSAK